MATTYYIEDDGCPMRTADHETFECLRKDGSWGHYELDAPLGYHHRGATEAEAKAAGAKWLEASNRPIEGTFGPKKKKGGAR